jgi:hypothetical protein
MKQFSLILMPSEAKICIPKKKRSLVNKISADLLDLSILIFMLLVAKTIGNSNYREFM